MAVVVVFDTNILIAALLSLQGAPFHGVALARLGRVESVTCGDILDEFTEKLQTKLGYTPAHAQAAAAEIRQFSRLATITHSLQVVAADPTDNKVIECAVVGGVTHIVTGDRRHLLPLGSYHGIAIVSAAEFLRLVATP